MAANRAGGGIVEFPPGTYRSVSIHLESNVTLRLDAGSTIAAASHGFDAAEPNPFSPFQDYGHSHFHDALIWGSRLTNVGFVGSGTIDGAGHLVIADPGPGQADKAISIMRSDGISISGITIKNGGHFGILINGCNHVRVDHLTIATASNRDGFNIVSTSNVSITNSTIASNDDALVFKSDFALGKHFLNQNVVVRNVSLSARCCNALMFGSETCGDFNHYTFSHITITGADKSGIGIVSMDGGKITNLRYSDITISRVSSAIFIRLGNRGRCPGNPPPGSISGITLTNITGSHLSASDQWTPTIAGLPGHNVSNITLNRVSLTLPGGHPTSDATVQPPEGADFNPRVFGARPAYGFWMRHVSGIHFIQVRVRLDHDDGRPAFLATSGDRITLEGVTVQHSSGGYDLGFAGIARYCVTDSTDNHGGALRIRATMGSTAVICDSLRGIARLRP
jgi:polygalacturonase